MADTASPAQLSYLERSLAAFRDRYAGLQSLDPRKLTAAQQQARTELLASGARIDAAVRTAIGVKESIAATVSGWWREVGNAFDAVRGKLGLGVLPVVIASAVALALAGSISAWLSSAAWAKLKDTGIKRSAHEVAVAAYDRAIAAGKSSEQAAREAEAAAGATGTDAGKKDDNAEKWAKWGALGLGALVALRIVSSALAPAPAPYQYPPRRRAP